MLQRALYGVEFRTRPPGKLRWGPWLHWEETADLGVAKVWRKRLEGDFRARVVAARRKARIGYDYQARVVPYDRRKP